VSGSRINIMIPTLNEAGHIAEVVANAKQTGDVFVLDSCSTDGTQELARQAGATVVEHAWEGYARQKNWGLDNLPFTGDWVFILDADERIRPELSRELREIVEKDEPVDGWYVNRLNLLLGRPVRHGGLYPSWNLRFFRLGKARYEDRTVHEHMIFSGPTGYTKGEMLISTGAEARALFRDMLRTRQWLRRHVWPRVPYRPFLRFMYMYVFRFGFLDGSAGFHLAMLMAGYEYMISLLYQDKLHRIRTGKLAVPEPTPDTGGTRSYNPGG
jgi:glycosyltransferase involved in cell wall biosynthesis